MSIRTTCSALALVALVAVVSGCSASGETSGDPNTEGAVSPPVILENGVLRVCASYGSPPNIYVDESGEPLGAEVDLAKELGQRLDLRAEFSEYAFAGLMPALQAQQCDVIMASLYVKPEREEVANFVTYLESGSGVAVHRSNPRGITGFDESLCGTDVLVNSGSIAIIEQIDELTLECEGDGKDPVRITPTDSNGAGLQQIVAQQVDAYIDTAALVGYYAKESGGDLIMTGQPFSAYEIGAATLKDNERLHEALTKAFEDMVEDGTYHSILDTWGMSADAIDAASNEGS